MGQNIARAAKETFYTLVSFWLNLVTVALSLVAGMLVHSNAMILDGVIGLVAVGVALAIMLTVKLLQHPPTATYQFGFFKLEPLIVALESGIIIAVCIQGLSHSIISFYHSHGIVDYAFAFVFQTANLIVNLVAFTVLWLAARSLSSDLIRVQYLDWELGLATALAIWVGILFGVVVHYFRVNELKPYLVYTDPILTILVVLLMIREPFRVFVNAVKDLVDARPDEWKEDEKLLAYAKETAARLGFGLKSLRITSRQAGRAIFVYLKYTPENIQNINQLYRFDDELTQYANATAKSEDSTIHFHCVLESESKIQV